MINNQNRPRETGAIYGGRLDPTSTAIPATAVTNEPTLALSSTAVKTPAAPTNDKAD